MRRRIRVLIAKPGLDGHEAGAKVIARAFMEAGMEVIYTGLRQTPEMIAQTALQEGVDIIGLSILSGAHNELCSRILRLLGQKGLGNIAVIVGGIVPREDIPILQEMGVKGVFGPGANTESVVEFVRTLVATA